jgi:hypothetical protein
MAGAAMTVWTLRLSLMMIFACISSAVGWTNEASTATERSSMPLRLNALARPAIYMGDWSLPSAVVPSADIASSHVLRAASTALTFEPLRCWQYPRLCAMSMDFLQLFVESGMSEYHLAQ